MNENGSQVAPEGLQAAGLALWLSVTTDYELDANEATRLVLACRLLDDLTRMEEELIDAPLLMESARGGPKINPLVAECRNHRSAVSRILVGLSLPDAVATPGQERSSAARAMARARWSGGSRSA